MLIKRNLKHLGAKSLKDLLKSGKPLEVISIKSKYLKKFAQEAKRYGVVYHVIKEKNNPEQSIDLIVDSENSKLCTRIVERYDLQATNNLKKGVLEKSEITKENASQEKNLQEPTQSQRAIESSNEKNNENKESEIGVSKPFLESENPYKNLLKNNEDFEIEEKMSLKETLVKLKDLFSKTRQKILSQESISKDDNPIKDYSKSRKEHDFER